MPKNVNFLVGIRDGLHNPSPDDTSDFLSVKRRSGSITFQRVDRLADSWVTRGGGAIADLFLLSEAQMLRIQPYFPLTHGIAMVDDRRGDQRDRCMERAELARCTGRLRSTQDDLQKFARWNRLELFKNIFAELARKGGVSQR